MTETPGKQLLHLVFGGELDSLDRTSSRTSRSSTSSGSSRTTPARTRPGRRRRRRPSTTRRCATSSSTCTVCSTRSEPERHRTDGPPQAHHPLAHRPGSPRLPGRALSCLVRRTNRFVMEPADAYDAHRAADAGDRRHVARAAFHDPFRQAAAGPGREPRLALRRRRAQRHRPAPSRHPRDPRLRRPRPRHPQEGRRRGPARHAAGACRRRDGGDDRRHPEDLARLRRRHRDAGAAVGPADRAGRGGDEPAHRFQKLGPGQPRPALRPRRDGAGRSRSACRATRTTRRSRAARQRVEHGLDAVHERAYALVGASDPGRPRRTGAAGRRPRREAGRHEACLS